MLDLTAATATGDRATLARIRAELDAAIADADAAGARAVGADAAGRASVANLLHYCAFRRVDRRSLQRELSALGLSSLGRSESAVLASLRAVRRAVGALLGEVASPQPSGAPGPTTIASGDELIRARTAALLGPETLGRAVRIMVTAPSELARDDALAKALVDAGMDILRINCAHDDADAWAAMVARVRDAARGAGRDCRILMDLAGPKARTGEIAPGPAVVHWNPPRDDIGRVVRPSRVALVAVGTEPELDADATLPLAPTFVAELREGDALEFEDLRGKRRGLRIEHVGPGFAIGSTPETAWVGPETELRAGILRARPERLPRIAQTIELRPGDRLLLSVDGAPGTPVPRAPDGRSLGPARIPFTLPELFADCRAGDRVRLDDGKIEATVESVDAEGLHLAVVAARGGGVKLGPDKGVNFPDARHDASSVRVPALTAKDLADLDRVVALADAVSLSFVRTPADLALLEQALAERGAAHLGIVLKIETTLGFAHLPELLSALLTRPCASLDAPAGGVGVMIARGDLAVECGWERLAEVQEEILWLCEAAHVPVIWATQVLETLAKRGLPSRSEITDAAMGVRAECVMLNKGPYVARAVATLDDVLRRMGEHQRKKRTMLRSLAVARRFIEALRAQ